MSSHDPRIQPLPPDVAAKIKSSTSITHLNGVVLELVKNSLDANAQTISVTVDFQRGGCVVEDDGDGIQPLEFEPEGGLGKAHHTSKYHSEKDVHGRRGLFLASLASLSLLTVTSRHHRHQNANTVIFHHATPVARLVPAPIQQGIKFLHGTSVTVNDLFGNMPVRVKSRALALQKPDELEREWDELKQVLVALMLAHDGLTKLVLSETGRSRKLTVRPRHQHSRTDEELDLQRIGSILSQAGLTVFHGSGNWNAVSACVPDFSIHAAISLVPSPTKKVQFISLGMESVFPQNNTNVLYSEINRLFAFSDFGTTGPPGLLPAAHPVDQNENSASSKAMPKAVNKWPMFYIRIETSLPQFLCNNGYEIVPESDKSVQRIMDVLTAMINEFLKQNNLRPRAGKRKRKTSKASPGDGAGDSEAKKTRSTTGQDRLDSLSTEDTLDGRLKLPSFQRAMPMNPKQNLGNWSRIKCAKEPLLNPRFAIRPQGEFASVGKQVCSSTTRHGDVSSSKQDAMKGLDHDSLDSAVQSTEFSHTPLQASDKDTGFKNELTDSTTPWKDPYTGRTHPINPRTGQSIQVKSPLDVALAGRRPQSTGPLLTGQVLDKIRRPRSAITDTTQNLWIDNLLKKWDNPTFSRPEKPIDSLDSGATHESELDKLAFKAHDCSGGSCGLEDFGLAKFRGKLRRQDLEMAEVVAQVDQKFILAKLGSSTHAHDSSTGEILTLIDQHAADERCRVERLFEELFSFAEGSRWGIQTVQIDPIVFEALPTEMSLLRREREFFLSWGVRYKIERRSGSKATFVCVETLPSLIAERCRIEPQLVTNLIRGEIWKREENGTGHRRSRYEDSFLAQSHIEDRCNPWVERLGGCPKGIVDLLNSRACRTAIMFNDVLTVDECQNLVTRLARCVFPFQCAHGRPSMVPILDMQSIGRFEYPMSDYQAHDSFGEAFKKRYP
ncbi:hypothetical protein ASPWEDRAFT_34705 [Aspergillus wentii DTO 134E9]|uniref:MutL C-terminal dimerisation domain-containing protein n=1 Tax=Aspergillus wentii DTO 134E9 TaxID=1073089 RepID=A0A1L9S211_ASPWE|nr:uncharacterized protein ASPWEDRAFT_34705 [Aspergillus wentii DTO 134E9]OJJ41207.1 hypothetical protein ASPWEDRAFT_34705 [Aspergillus wentii DTO 134E9]